jgi:hypothetical protein
MIRGVGEGLLGGSLGQMVVFNPYKHRKAKKKKLNLLDKIEIKLRIPNLKDPRPPARLAVHATRAGLRPPVRDPRLLVRVLRAQGPPRAHQRFESPSHIATETR